MLYGSGEQFRQTNVVDEDLGEGTARVNLFGFAVAEIDYVRPFDRPLKGWMWQFNFRPGF